MYRPNPFRFSSFSLFLLIFLTSAFAQAQPGELTNDVFDAKLQVILASDRASAQKAVPSSLSAITGTLTREFGLSNFQLIDTQIGRLGDRGTLETKAAVEIDDPVATAGLPAYTEWSIADSRSGGSPEGSAITIGSFRYTIRLSTRKALADMEPGKPGSVVSYESFGHSLNRLSVPDAVPTVVGSISLPKGTGKLFLILTVTKNVK